MSTHTYLSVFGGEEIGNAAAVNVVMSFDQWFSRYTHFADGFRGKEHLDPKTQTMMNFEEASNLDILHVLKNDDILAVLSKESHWIKVRLRFMKKYPKEAKSTKADYKDPVVINLYRSLRGARTIKEILGSLETIRDLLKVDKHVRAPPDTTISRSRQSLDDLSFDDYLSRSFQLQQPLKTADSAELLSLQEMFEDIIDSIMDSTLNEFRDQLKKEAEQLISASRFKYLGILMNDLSSAIPHFGGAPEVTKIALNILGLHVPHREMPPPPTLKQLEYPKADISDSSD